MEEVEKVKTFKDMLLEYTDYKAQIKLKELNIRTLEKMEIGCGGGLGDGQPKPTGYMESTLENKVIRKLDNISRLKADKSELEAKVEMIDSIIDTLSATHREYIRLRFKEKWEIAQVADHCNIEKDSMKVTLQSITDKLENKYKKLNAQVS